jgi:CHAD domain-containing protein
MPEPLQGAGPELLAHLRRERAVAHETVLGMLRAGPHRADLARLEHLGAPAAMVPEIALQPASEAMRACVREAARRLRRLVGELGPDAPTPDVHRARIAVKRLRYLVDELAPAPGRRGRKARARLERAQVRLGTFCDHETAARQYLDLLAASDPSRSRAFHALLGGLASLHAERARRARTRAITAARQLGRRKFQERLEGEN